MVEATYGLAKWLEEYTKARPSLDVLQQEVDDYMSTFDEQQTKKKQDNAYTRAHVDDDGFIKVVRGGRRGVVSDGRQTISVATKREIKALQENESSRPASSHLKSNFYRFQARQGKQQQLQDLKKRFDQDKQRIAAMKLTRQFHPH